MYLADKKHLHEWGRTITGDKYVKMEHGVTPSATYDMLKAVRGDKDWPRDLGAYFRVERREKVIPVADPDLEELRVRIEILDAIFAEDGGKSFRELKNKAHDDAYRDAIGHWIDDEDVAEGDPALIAHIRQAKDDRFPRKLVVLGGCHAKKRAGYTRLL